MRPGGSTGWATVDKMIRGHAKKARINSEDVLADALEKAYKKLKNQIKGHSDLDADIQRSRIPDHLKFLAALSNPPSSSTLDTAEAIIDRIDNPQPEKAKLTWKDIFAEEPLEGQHWEGAYGLPPGTTVENWETRSDGSSPSLSPWDSDSDLDESRPASRLSDVPETPPTPPTEGTDPEVPRLDPPLDPMNAYRHRQDVEELHSRQYWRSDWRSDASVHQQFDLGNASSLAPAFHRALGSRAVLSIDGPNKENYRYEEDIVREVLTGLQGRRNMMFTWVHSGPEAFSFVLSSSAPRLLHLTAGAQASIISSFATLATVLVHLRKFTSAIFTKASGNIPPTSDGQGQPAYLTRAQRRITQTLEAFADALDAEVRAFDAWCAQREEDMCHARAGLGGKLVVSLLSLEKAIRDSFGSSFPVLLDIVRLVVRRSQRLHDDDEATEVWTLPDLPQRAPPSTIAAILLDALLVAVQDHVSMGDAVTSSAIVRVFTASAEPVWSMIHKWMRDGMPVRDGQLGALPLAAQVHSPLKTLQDEFFVEDNELLVLDPDFWAEGFALRDGHSGSAQDEDADGLGRPTSVPVFLVHVAQLVLATGKVAGLLRVLGISALFDGERLEDGTTTRPWMADWRSFKTLLKQPRVHECIDGTGEVTASLEGAVASSENLSRIVYDELLPYSELAHEALRKVLVDECELWAHLNVMEDLFLMRRGDAMSHFVDVLFTRMDTRERWNDFHFMNSAFRDVVSLYSGRTRWIDASLVRFSFPHKAQGQGALQEKNIAQTVRALVGLLIEYAVPFPLTYIFGPRAMRVYSSIFTLVLQIRRAKSVLERILVRGGLAAGKQLDAEMKVFYAMRGRLSWFVNTLLNFITTNVIHTQILKFHEAFRQARSFDDMIRLQNEHLDKLEGRCLLQKNTVALHRAIMSILDMSLHYTECFVSFAGDTTHDISRASLVSSRHRHRHRHRSRRLRKQRRDVIGFSDAPSLLQHSEDDSSDEEGLDEESLAGRSGREPSFSFGASTTASFTEDGFLERLDKMSSELDALVRFVRRGVESLAAGASEAAPAFGIFAFALEDWDR
ncbi:Spc98 family-domain-containing protein [Dichomitus squalens]|uniref:Spindle pole body component n=1 Tax=Dichomitus squalens TaxID=114155 RepID=A0A4Q9NKL8_9APHY|nr:Spc98 family-domain-containing protein [Dichomitus squalens]TBU63218.1 Spc98 family-domain-containing protein [Dichomitus squalens]